MGKKKKTEEPPKKVKKIKIDPVAKPPIDTLNFKGCSHFRQRIVCATLSGKAVRITDIRSKDEQPGVRGNSL